MKVNVSNALGKFGIACVPIAEGGKLQGAGKAADAALANSISSLSKKEFSGKAGQVSVVAAGGRKAVAFGLGKKEEYCTDLVRQAAGITAKTAAGTGMKTAAIILPGIAKPAEEAAAAVQGAILGSYRFDKYFTSPDEEKPRPVGEITIITTARPDSLKQAIAYATVTAECANFSRDLSNESGEAATPAAIAGRMAAEARKHGVSCQVIGGAEARKMGMGAFWSVASGSARPAKIVVLEHKGRGGRPIVLVGKGITFDSGGISIKPSQGMEKMKHDKSGAAAVAGAVIAAARLGVRQRVVGVMPLCENMPSGSATKPGDVVKAYNGKTIEVFNTDAEGRMVLADALAYAVKRYSPKAILDMATLTGACFVALGDVCSGLMANDGKVAARVAAAGDAEWERVWQLPMHRDYDEKVKSTVADVKNVGAPQGEAGAIAGASFLKNFVGETPWAHVDIAGTAYGDKEKAYVQPGATGVGARLLARLVYEWKD